MKNSNDTITVTGLGEALWDVLPEGRKIGGAPANFAYHVSQFGFDGHAVSAVGNDELGRELLSKFRERGLKTEMPMVDYPTGTVDVELDDRGVPRYEIRKDVAWDHIPWTPEIESLARRTRAASFGSLAQRSEESRSTIRRFLQAMPEGEDVLKIFDINIRQHFYSQALIEESLQMCNVLKINDEELELVGDMLGLSDDSLLKAARELRERYGLRMVVLTCGPEGSYVVGDGVTSFIATPEVEVADTVGAGDSFSAGLTAGLLSGLDIASAHRLAVDVSAHVCTCHGAMPHLPEKLLHRSGLAR